MPTFNSPQGPSEAEVQDGIRRCYALIRQMLEQGGRHEQGMKIVRQAARKVAWQIVSERGTRDGA